MSEHRAEIRLATENDAPAIGALIHALDAHYRGLTHAPAITAATQMVRHTIATREGAHFVLAIAESGPVGLAIFAILRPGRDLKGVLYVKEIFVRPEARGQGVGTALLRFLKAEAQRRGIGRIDLTTDPDNRGAQRLYARLGGERLEKIAYRFWIEPGHLEP